MFDRIFFVFLLFKNRAAWSFFPLRTNFLIFFWMAFCLPVNRAGFSGLSVTNAEILRGSNTGFLGSFAFFRLPFHCKAKYPIGLGVISVILQPFPKF